MVSGTDTSKPTATSFARTPASVDVRTSNKSVTVTVHAKDTGSGIGYAYATFSNCERLDGVRLDAPHLRHRQERRLEGHRHRAALRRLPRHLEGASW